MLWLVQKIGQFWNKKRRIDDKCPIPNLNGILNKLGKSKYFTTLDLAKGFQILVKTENQKKTAFSTPFAHYEFIRMPFSL